MTMCKLVVLTMCAILAAGCATSTRSTMLTDDTVLVSVLGQNANDKQRIVERAIGEAARVVREHGYRYFVIVDAADGSQRGVRRLPGRKITIDTAPLRNSGTVRPNSLYVAAGGYNGPDRIVPYVRIGLDITIRMYHEGEVDAAFPGVWSSDNVLSGAPPGR